MAFKFKVRLFYDGVNSGLGLAGSTDNIIPGEGVAFDCCKISGLSSETTIMKVNQVTSPLTRFLPTHITYGNVTFEQGVFDRGRTFTAAELVRIMASSDLERRPLYKIEIRAYTKASREITYYGDLSPSVRKSLGYFSSFYKPEKRTGPLLDFKSIILRGCYPVKFTYSDLDAKESAILFNSIEFAVSHMDLAANYNDLPGSARAAEHDVDVLTI